MGSLKFKNIGLSPIAHRVKLSVGNGLPSGGPGLSIPMLNGLWFSAVGH